jgi:hypothetical protein
MELADREDGQQRAHGMVEERQARKGLSLMQPASPPACACGQLHSCTPAIKQKQGAHQRGPRCRGQFR